MLEQLVESVTLIASQTKTNIVFLSQMLILLWGIFFINLFLGKHLLRLGIFPRHISGLPGIICAPFLHVDFNHLFFNSIPLVILANFILVQGIPYFLEVTWIIIVLSGALTWCFARYGLHVGASGVITGYWALLVADIYHQGTLTAIILGLVCLYYFAGILFSIFPGERNVSWQGHLFGLISGLIVSYIT
ncbi:MAG TPA: rhomboid family intramembrane serine protease [Legionellaceae bacterium]|nr:rhomboid family intramembrane serine protease [Legionellaceae bacterium]